LHADIAHPINSAAREVIQSAVLRSYQEEKERSKLPGYICKYDEYDAGDIEETYTSLIGDLNGAPRSTSTEGYRTHAAHGGMRGTHASNHESKTPVAAREEDREGKFGAGIL